MAGLIDTLTSTRGRPGRRVYKTETPLDKFSGMNLKEKLQAIVLEKRLAHRETRQRMNLAYSLMAYYYRGYQQIATNSSGGLDVFEDEEFYVENQFRRHVDTVKQILNKMEGDLIIRPASDSPSDIACARVADPVLEMQRNDIGYDRIIDEKNLYRCLFGNAFKFTDYIVDAKYGSIVTPKYGYKEVPDPDFDPMDPTASPTILSKVLEGYDTRNRGKQIATVCTPLEINVDPHVRPFTEAPYLQWISRQDLELIEYLYPGLKLEGGSAIETDLGQQYIATLGNLAGNVLGGELVTAGSSTNDSKVELVRSWLKPCTFRNDKELLKQFPEGVHVATVDGMVVEYYPEDLCDRWTHEILIPVPHSLLGDGLYDAILLQDQINEINTLLIQHMRYTTTGKTYYDSQAIDVKDYINDPKYSAIPVKLALDKNITQAVMQTGPTQLSGDVPAWLGAVKQAMQDMTGAYDPEAGKSTGANTPYSQSVFLSEKAQSRWKGSHSYNAPERVRFHVHLLEDARTNWVDMRQRAVMDNTGQWSFQQFSQADLQGDVDISMTDADFKPKTRAEQVQALSMLATLMPIIQALPPKQRLRVEEILALPPDGNPMSNQISRVYRIIDRIKKGEEVGPLALVDDPMAQVPVFRDFLISEDGEALAESDQESFIKIYTYMTSLLFQGMQKMTSPAGQLIGQMDGTAQQQPQAGPSQPNQDGKQPGGQLGQKGGGAGSMNQPDAQTPAKPAPPVSPPSPT